MGSKQRLIDINSKQKSFYESKFTAGRARNPSANLATAIWVWLRKQQQRSEKRSGIREAVVSKHREWLGDLADKDVLDLGCYSGNTLSVQIAQSAKSYTGIDLSEQAIQTLRSKLEGIPGAQAKAVDFLAEDYHQDFDIIYAHGVLHHFEDFDLLCAELHKALRPGGMVVSIDPLQTDPTIRLARALYRPFQADKDWEWPFDRSNFATLRQYFAIEAVQGFRGFSKLGILAGPWSPRVSQWGCRRDLATADRFGLPLALCWMVAMKCVKPEA